MKSPDKPMKKMILCKEDPAWGDLLCTSAVLLKREKRERVEIALLYDPVVVLFKQKTIQR